MHTRIGRRLLRLILVPLSGVVLLLSILAIVEIQTITTQSRLRHSAVVVQLSQQVALALARGDASVARGGSGTLAASTRLAIVRDFATLHVLVADDEAQTVRLKLYASAARAHIDRPTNAAISRTLDRAQQAFDRVEADNQRIRRADFDRLRDGLLWTLGLAAAIVILSTIFTYRALSTSIARRLEALSENTLRFATGQPVGAPDAGDDEIGDVDARFRHFYEMLADREATAARYRILAEQTSDIMFFLDGERVVEANEAAADAYGYTREELRTKTIYDLRIPETHDEVRKIFEHPEEHVKSYETIHRRRDGSQFPVEITLRQADIGGRQINCIVARDVSARQEADGRLRAAVLQANEASRLKSEFVATMSHEIRTPMNAILGMTELLLGTSLDTEQYELATTVHSSGQSLLRIIDDVLDFSKIEAGRLDVEARAFSLTTCVESVALLLASQAQRKGIVLTAFVPPELPKLIVGDDLRVRQILTNLVGNALKFTAAGSIAVVGSILARNATTVSVRIEVRDTGIGLDPSASARLFTAFSQADGSTTRRYGGTGLGLTISKRLVELMGGKIGFTSKRHIGSTFWFELPFHIATEQPLTLQALSCGRVLVADVSRPARDITTAYLRAWGVDVDVAGSQDEIERLCSDRAALGTPYALAFIDISLAPSDSATLRRRIGKASGTTYVPVVLTSAFDSNEIGRDAVRDGFSGLLIKPLRQSLLFDCLSTFAGAKDLAPSVHEPDRISAMKSLAAVSPVDVPERDVASIKSLGHVLLVEDNPVNQRVGRKQLEKIGYTVTCADNGRIAVDALQRDRYDIVFMDLQMPEMDGLTATRTIRRNELGTGKHVPIVALTADASADDRTKCLASGMDDYLAKPVAIPELRAALERSLRVSA